MIISNFYIFGIRQETLNQKFPFRLLVGILFSFTIDGVEFSGFGVFSIFFNSQKMLSSNFSGTIFRISSWFSNKIRRFFQNFVKLFDIWQESLNIRNFFLVIWFGDFLNSNWQDRIFFGFQVELIFQNFQKKLKIFQEILTILKLFYKLYTAFWRLLKINQKFRQMSDFVKVSTILGPSINSYKSPLHSQFRHCLAKKKTILFSY